MSASLNRHQATLPAGRYVVGDPCGCLDPDEWDKVLTLTNCFENKCHAPFVKHDGGEGLIVAFPTAHGDGEYDDQEGNSYGVDSGLLGIIAVGDLPEGEQDGMHVVEFHNPVRCHLSGSTIVFGHLEINTDGGSDEDDNDGGYDDPW